MRSVRLPMLNGKNWIVWKFQFEQIMRANNLLDILDGSIKRPMKIMESDKNSRTIMKNQKDIDGWKRLDGWTMAILSISGAHRGACHSDIVIRLLICES